MCGICGCLNYEGLSQHETAATTRMIQQMVRRGPDDEGFWSDGKHCQLGFRRLSILDLSPAGHQPMLTPDGRYALIYNGEVYNYDVLRQELQKEDLVFRSTGDTEVILHLLAKYGKDGLCRLNGMFALAFYDALTRRLLLARDHAGIKPLYYLLATKGLVFASQYDQLLGHPWARGLQVDAEAMGLYLRLGYIPAPRALLKQSHMLEPGSWLEIEAAGRVRQGRFFEFPVRTQAVLKGEAAVEAVNEAVTRAVRRQLVSDVPLGTFLSGGVDSPLVAAKMKQAGQGPVHAFTLGTRGDALDESPDALAYAREIGVRHTIHQVTACDALEMLDDVIASCGEPFADYSIFPTMLISRLARQQVTVMLSGDGGDELFWGYPSRFGTVLHGSHQFAQPYWLRVLRAMAERPFHLKNGHTALPYRTIGDWYRRMHTRIPEGCLAALFPQAPAWPPDFTLFHWNATENDSTAQWMRWNEFVSHLTMVLMKVDRASMHHSLEVRVPLLDREVIAVAASVDWQSCLDVERKVGKILLRKILSRHVGHQSVVKRGFEVPMDAWLRGPLKSIFSDALLKRKDLVGLPLNPRRLEQIFRQHLSGRSNHGRALWTLLSLALWERKHFKAA
jgi:asparagine synthase (glutamine-hydrolysing)